MGDNISGKKVSSFSDPVCNMFREKIVDGQVCYEADINQFKNLEIDWTNAYQKGFGFIVDTNDEYDVKNWNMKEGATAVFS